MILSAIVAVSENNAIGVNNDLPWRLPDDLKFFKRTTMGCPVLMGRKTFESLGRPLPGRLNVVISRQKDLQLPEGVLLCNSLEEGIARIEQEGTEEGFVIGGGNIYKQAMPLLNKLYITQVHTMLDNADTFFPEVDKEKWQLTWEEHHDKDERHAYDFTFQKWERM